MTAGLQGVNEVSLSFEDSGGSARDIHDLVLGGFNPKLMARMAKIDGLGEAWERHTHTGKKGMDPITIEGVYDTGANKSHVIFKDVGGSPRDAGREIVYDPGDGKTWTFDVKIMSYEVMAENENVQKFRSEVQPTGTVVLV